MQLPAGLIHAGTGLFTSGVANTQVTTNVAAAPIAGFRLRIWAFGGGAQLSNAAAHQLALLFQQAAGAPRWAYLVSSPGGQSFVDHQVPGGLALASATAFQCIQSANVATLSIHLWVEYTVERG